MAQSTLEESQMLFLEIQNRWEYAHTVMCLAKRAYRQNELTISLNLHEQGLALFREIGDRYFQCFALYYVGVLEVKQGDVKHGIAALREALILAQQLDGKYGISGLLWRFSEVAQLVGNPAHAVRLLLAAKNISDSIGAWREKDESNFENTMASCRAALGESAFAEAVEQGQAMTMEQAIAYALNE